MSGSHWIARWGEDGMPLIEWHGAAWQWVPTGKRRSDGEVLMILQQLLATRREKDYAMADQFRAKLTNDGATVTIDKEGIIRVNY